MKHGMININDVLSGLYILTLYNDSEQIGKYKFIN